MRQAATIPQSGYLPHTFAVGSGSLKGMRSGN